MNQNSKILVHNCFLNLSLTLIYCFQQCLDLLDGGARDALSDVITKNLRKLSNQPEGKEEELDDTLLTWLVEYCLINHVSPFGGVPPIWGGPTDPTSPIVVF